MKGEPTSPLFVRLPAASAEKLSRAAFELKTPKRELVADLVGIDVHIHASEALYDKLGEERMAPPERLLQLQREGRLGRKTGHGFFDYE